MSSSEIAFLVFGVVLGGALGAAFLAVARSRPGPRREVRITIAPNAIAPRRPTTLSSPASGRATGPDTLAGDDPGGRAGSDAAAAPDTDAPIGAPGWIAPIRTRVPFGSPQLPANAVAVPVVVSAAALPNQSSFGLRPGPAAPVVGGEAAPQPGRRDTVSASLARSAVAIAADSPSLARPAADPLDATLDPGPASPEGPVRPRPPQAGRGPALHGPAIGIPVMDSAAVGTPVMDGRAAAAAWAGTRAADPDPCAELRSRTAERSAEARAASTRANVAADALRGARRDLQALDQTLDRARAAMDPRAISDAKAGLQAEFRRASAGDNSGGAGIATQTGAGTGTATATGRWMTGISRVNADARTAARQTLTVEAHRVSGQRAVERLEAVADVARFAVDAAASELRSALEALAACEGEAATPSGAAATAPESPAAAPSAGAGGLPLPQGGTAGATAVHAGRPAIDRILAGEQAALERVVVAMAAGDVAAGAAWRVRLTALAEAIRAAAIDGAFLDLPDTDPFWSLFDPQERRDVVRALAAIGYRYDGLRGFADGRVPAPRDLTLAVGYAGLDRMRMRTWPRETDLEGLFAGATVATPEWRKAEAEDLALGSLVDALGSSAAAFADLWNAWGRLRPALLATD